MKKSLFVFLVLIVLGTSAYAASEEWFSIGIESGNFFESVSGIDSQVTAFGLEMSEYMFFNNMPVGIMMHGSFSLLQKLSGTAEGVKVSIDLSGSDLRMYVGLLAGLAYKHHFTETLGLFAGLGFSFGMFTLIHPNFSLGFYNYGIGGDVGVKYSITDSFFVDLGLLLNYDFKNKGINSSASTVKGYKMFGVRPYLGVGFIIERGGGASRR